MAGYLTVSLAGCGFSGKNRKGDVWGCDLSQAATSGKSVTEKHFLSLLQLRLILNRMYAGPAGNQDQSRKNSQFADGLRAFPVTEESQKPHVSSGVARTAEQPASGIREVRFEQISGGQTELIVEYAGQKYRLLATKNGRLVLNK